MRIKSFSCSVAKAWNCIPLSIRSLSKHKFKAAIHCQLVDILLFEDDYMLTRLLLPLDLNSFEVCDISHFVNIKLFFLTLFIFSKPLLTLVYTICK